MIFSALPRKGVSCPYLSIELFFNPCPSTADSVSRTGTALASRCYPRLVRISRLKRAGSREEKEMRVFTRSLAAAILTAGCFLSIHSVNVLAQSPPPGPSTSAPDLSDQKLSAVAAAIERVASLQNDYRQRIAEAEAPAEKERIVAEAHNEFTKAVTEQGLSVEEYASILDMAQDDPEIRDKLLQRIRPSDK
jgi:Domain of unknown function (DUF4168)